MLKEIEWEIISSIRGTKIIFFCNYSYYIYMYS